MLSSSQTSVNSIMRIPSLICIPEGSPWFSDGSEVYSHQCWSPQAWNQERNNNREVPRTALEHAGAVSQEAGQR